MKRLSKLLILIFVLIIIAVILIVVIRNLTSSISTSDEENVENGQQDNFIDDTINSVNEEYYMIEPTNYREAVSTYSGETELIEVKRNLYQLVKKYIPKIYEETKQVDGLEEYYNSHTKEINDMNILTKEDFIALASKIKDYKIVEKDEIYPKAEPIDSQDENYYAFKLVLSYGGNRELNIVVNINKQENGIKYTLYDELEEVFKIYQGNTSKKEVENLIKSMASNAPAIYNNIKGLSLNKILQYYDLHTQEINSYNIYDRDSFLSVTNQIVRVVWEENPKLRYYKIPKDTIQSLKSSIAFDVQYIYSNGNIMTLNVNINVMSNMITISAKEQK